MKKVISILFLCGGLALLIYGLFSPPSMPSHYSGQCTFQTQQEYTDFKLAIAQSNVTEWKADVLSSGLPIIVSFKATVAPNSTFPYGNKAEGFEESWLVQSPALVIVLVLFFISFIFFAWSTKRKE